MPDARRPFRNQERKAWRDGGDGRESAPAKPCPQSASAQTVKLRGLSSHHPILLQIPTMTWQPPPITLFSISEPRFPKLCNAEHSRQSAKSAGSGTKIAEPKSEDRKTPRCHPWAALSLLSQTSGHKLFPDPGLMAFTSWCSANRLQTPHPYILLAQASPRLARGPAPCSLDHLALQSAHSYLSIGCPSSNQELPPLRYRSTLPP